MKIIFFHTNLGVGGIEKSLVNLVNKLSNYYEIQIVLLNKEGLFIKDLNPSIKVYQADKKLIIFGTSNKESKKKGIVFFVKRNIMALKRKLSQNEKWIEKYIDKTRISYECDIAVAYTDDPFVMDLVLRKCHSNKKFVFYHSDFRNKHFKNDDYKNRALKFNKFICVSKSCKSVTESCCPELSNITDYLYNCVNVPNEIEPFEYDNKFFNILTVARVSYEKRIDWGIEIVSKLIDEGFKIRYYICGNGKDFDKNKNLIKKLNKQQSIFLLGEQKDPYKFIKEADLLMLLSKTESFGISIIEGFKLGIPCLTTDTVSAREIVGDKGYVCEHNKEYIYNQLKSIINNQSDLKLKRDKLTAYRFDNDENIRRFMKFCE